jgi:hypothetical protein
MRPWRVNFSSKRRGIGLAVLVIAVVVIGFGGWTLRSWNWDTADGQVQSCEVVSTVNHNNNRTSKTNHCVVRWTFDGREHQAALDFPGAVDRTGSTEKLLVNGDSAQGYSGRYFGLIVAGFGVLLAIGGLLLRRS